MAQYVPYIPEVLPETPLFKPDFNFFDRMMQRKQSMFEQGLSKARTAYTSVLNAPLSVKENIPLRDQFIKDAKENLKNLASSDLSLPQNVAAAENVFAPFWEDKFILKDMELTKSYQDGFQILDAWKNSSDPKVREQYNGITERYLMNGYEKLQNATRDDKSFGALEKRKALPFTNIESYLQDQAKEEKLEIKYDDPNGPYLIETINGQRSLKKYQAWALSKIGNNFYQQFNVTGIVEKEERAKNYKKQFPNYTDDQINALIAKDVISELDAGYKRRTQEVDVEIARVDNLLKSIAETKNPANQELFDNLMGERMNLNARKAGISEEYKYFDQPEKDKIYSNVVSNPDAYFATLAKQRLADNWAKGKAAIESKLVKENVAYTAAENLMLRRKEYDLNVQKAQWDRDQDLWERVNAKPGTETKKTSLKDKDGNDIVTPTEQAEKTLMYNGYSKIDITRNEATAYDRFVKKQNQDFYQAHAMIFDQKGLLSLSKNLGLQENEISFVAAALQKEVADYNYNFSKEENAAVSKLAKALLANEGVKTAGITKVTGPGTLRNALIAYAQGYFKERNEKSKDGYDIPLNDQERGALMRYMTATELLNNFNANEERRNQIVQQKIIPNKEYSKIVVDRDGKKDILTISDLAKEMPSLTLSYRDSFFGDSKEVVLSPEEVSKAYMSGNITGMIHSRAYGNHIKYNNDGRTYSVKAVGKTKIEAGYDWEKPFSDWWNKVTEKYGTPEELSKMMKKANHDAVPDLLMYKNQSGKQGASFTLIPLENKSGNDDMAWGVVNEAVKNGDFVIYDDANATYTPLEANKIKALTTLLSSEKNVEKFTSIEYIPQGVDGKRTVRLYFKEPTSEEDKKIIANEDLNSIFNMGKIEVVLNDNTQTPFINALPNNTGYQVFDILSRGRVFKSDPVLAASGFDYTITPNVLSSDGRPNETPTYVTVNLKFNERINEKDPKTGLLTTKVKPMDISKTIDLAGPNAKSPDEIVNYLNQLYIDNMLKNKIKMDEYTEFLKTNPTAAQQSVDYNERLRKAGLQNLTTN